MFESAESGDSGSVGTTDSAPSSDYIPSVAAPSYGG
jgi:hypothetical protein